MIEEKNNKYDKYDDHAILAVIAQQVETMVSELKKVQEKIEIIQLNYTTKEEYQYFKNEINQKIKSITDNYVHKEQFKPVRLIIYGAAGLIGIAFMTALIKTIISG